jgi:hypothetical protein
MARRFTVSGSGNFPLFMLHFSKCYPATSSDAEKLSYAIPTQAREQIIMLETNAPLSVGAPHLWKAAKWPIVSTD